MFSNLLGNALRHTPAGGSVQINVQSQDGQVRFEVADTGEGIPPEYQTAIFERFFRVPRPSSGAVGLGLPLAREIVAATSRHDGLCSTPGEGSTFWFTLPQTSGEPGHDVSYFLPFRQRVEASMPRICAASSTEPVRDSRPGCAAARSLRA